MARLQFRKRDWMPEARSSLIRQTQVDARSRAMGAGAALACGRVACVAKKLRVVVHVPGRHFLLKESYNKDANNCKQAAARSRVLQALRGLSPAGGRP